MEKENAGLEEIVKAASGDRAQKMYREGDIHPGMISCGQGVGLVRKIMPLKNIVEQIIYEADELRHKLARSS